MFIVSVRKTSPKQNKTLQTLKKSSPEINQTTMLYNTPPEPGAEWKGKQNNNKKIFWGAIKKADFFAQKIFKQKLEFVPSQSFSLPHLSGWNMYWKCFAPRLTIMLHSMKRKSFCNPSKQKRNKAKVHKLYFFDFHSSFSLNPRGLMFKIVFLCKKFLNESTAATTIILNNDTLYALNGKILKKPYEAIDKTYRNDNLIASDKAKAESPES